MKIDVFTHIIPIDYKEVLFKSAPPGFYLQNVIESLPTMFDLKRRFAVMDKFDGLMQVLTLSGPPVEEISDPARSRDLARLANDSMADLVSRYPDRFAAAVACLPLNDIDAALDETNRAIMDLSLRGIQLNTPVEGKPLDAPEFTPLFETMARFNLPIWLHPQRSSERADYEREKYSKYMISHTIGWPYETGAAMTRLVCSGIIEKYPELKIITHHAGGVVPYFGHRIAGAYDYAEFVMHTAKYKQRLRKAPIDYFKMFYADTAVYGNTPALMCAHAFFGTDHLLFGTDFPFDNQFGERYTRQTMEAVEEMAIEESEKKRIFEENARKLLRLPL